MDANDDAFRVTLSSISFITAQYDGEQQENEVEFDAESSTVMALLVNKYDAKVGSFVIEIQLEDIRSDSMSASYSF